MSKSFVARSGASSRAKPKWAAALAGAALCSGALVSAAYAAHTAVVKAACKTDYYKFCPAYKVDTPQMRACMRSAGGNLSQRCIDALADAGEISRKYHSSNRKK